MIRVVVCDDQLIVTEGLRIILESASDISVIGIAHDGAEALDLVGERHPDLVLMDLRMPIMNGIQATRKIREQYPASHVLILTTYDDDEWVFDAIRASQESRKADLLIVDTAGRLQTKYNLMKELEKITRVASKQVHRAPHEVLLVVDASTGQNAISQAKAFKESAGVTVAAQGPGTHDESRRGVPFF